MKNIILIIDPFSTGKLYAQQFTQLGYQCYSVLSHQNVPDFFKQSYDNRYFQNDQLLSIDEVKNTFSKDQIQAVVIGSETGVISGELLADYFNVAGNSIKNTAFRRDKFQMQAKLATQGLAHIASQIITPHHFDIQSLPDYTAYVLKPINSAGTENVFFCQNKAELQQQINQIQWGSVNATGEKNNAFLVQEFIEGTEFVVDMVVDHSGIYTASLCRYHKGEYNGSRFVYEYMEMLNPQAKAFQSIIHYAHQCTQALGFQFGPVHMEIMHNENKTVMIEAGARLHGGIAPQIFRACYQPDLLTLAVQGYLNQPLTETKVKQTHFARVIFMINQREKASLDVEKFQQAIQHFPSYRECIISCVNNIPLTTDLLTCPCFVALTSSSQEQIIQDERQIRQLFDQSLKI